MKRSVCSIFVLFMLLSCNQHISKSVLDNMNAMVDSVRIRYVPDIRDDVFDISIFQHEKKLVVKGVTTVAEAKTELLNQLGTLRSDVLDSIRVLPDPDYGDRIYAVINLAVANLRVEPKDDGELATQLLLGAVVETLHNEKVWYRVRTPEGYIAWIHSSSFVRMNREQLEAWKSAPKVIFSNNNIGMSYETPDENGRTASGLTFGNLLKLEGDSGRFYYVSYPYGRKAFVLKTQSQKLDDWKAGIQLTEESIVQKALALRRKPYLWGGTSTNEMDCSGFVKIVYQQHGIVLRRDASQQVKTGMPVDISAGYDNLRPGDLLFFGTKAEEDRDERVRHVGIYMGNKEFVHASGGDVHVSSFDPEHQYYDEGNTKEFIYARRMLGMIGMEGILEWE